MSVRVLSWVFDHSPVEHRGDLLVLLVLADCARDDGSGAYPSVEKLGRKARLSRRGVFDALIRLKAVGAIEAQGRGPHRTVSYRVVMAGTVQLLHGATTARVQSATRKGAVATAPNPSGTVQVPPYKSPKGDTSAARPGGARAQRRVRHELSEETENAVRSWEQRS
jgi:hypothetical protein